MNELNDKIITWLKQHGIDKLSPDKQYLKIIEEVGELARGLLKNDLEAIKDAIGDIYVAVMGLRLQTRMVDYNFYYDTTSIHDLIILKRLISEFGESVKGVADFGLISLCLEEIAIRNNLTLKECVEHAYNEIKDRDIRIENGVAVK